MQSSLFVLCSKYYAIAICSYVVKVLAFQLPVVLCAFSGLILIVSNRKGNTALTIAMSQLYSGSMPDWRVKSEIVFITTALRLAVQCTPLWQCLGSLSLLPSKGH